MNLLKSPAEMAITLRQQYSSWPILSIGALSYCSAFCALIIERKVHRK
jgi:hypothetical protein